MINQYLRQPFEIPSGVHEPAAQADHIGTSILNPNSQTLTSKPDAGGGGRQKPGSGERSPN